jgi:hypothetical protein
MRPRSVRTNGRGGCLAVLLGGGWALGGAADGTPGAAGLTTPRWVKAGRRVPATAAGGVEVDPLDLGHQGLTQVREAPLQLVIGYGVTVGLLPVGELSGKALAGARQAGLDRADGQGQVAGDLLDRQVGQVVQGQHLPVAQ